MKHNRLLFYFLVAGAVGVWIGNACVIVSLLISPRPMVAPGARSVQDDDGLLSNFTRADHALKCKPMTDAFRFSGNFDDPFRLPSEAFAAPVKKKNPSPAARINLTLKGVLLKERPLAILEDGAGKTFICGIGETIQEHTVASIEPNRITLRGSGGVYTLSVKE